MTHHSEEPLMSALEEEYRAKGYKFKRERTFTFKGRRYALDAVASKGSETICFELKTHVRNIDYIFYRLLAYSIHNKNIHEFYLVLPAHAALDKGFMNKLGEFGIGLIRIDPDARKTSVEIKAHPIDFAKNQALLAGALHLSPNAGDVFDKALHLFGRETPMDVVREFVDSVLNNVLLGGLLASGIVLVTQNHVPPSAIDIVAFVFIAIALIAWAFRLAIAYGMI